jgi:hypothetical protein
VKLSGQAGVVDSSRARSAESDPAGAATLESRQPFWVAPLICAVVPLLCIPFAEWQAVAPRGSRDMLQLKNLIGLLALLAGPAAIVSLAGGLAFQRFRRIALLSALSSAVFWCAFMVARPLGDRIRTNAFLRLAERSEPLVDAIRDYESKYGRPPKSLPALVPQFIPAIPATQIGAYPRFDYLNHPTNYEGNPWVLKISSVKNGVTLDRFLYFPLGNYPQSGYGGTLERVGEWAYVSE